MVKFAACGVAAPYLNSAIVLTAVMALHVTCTPGFVTCASAAVLQACCQAQSYEFSRQVFMREHTLATTVFYMKMDAVWAEVALKAAAGVPLKLLQPLRLAA